jgi:hypothetical protein
MKSQTVSGLWSRSLRLARWSWRDCERAPGRSLQHFGDRGPDGAFVATSAFKTLPDRFQRGLITGRWPLRKPSLGSASITFGRNLGLSGSTVFPICAEEHSHHRTQSLLLLQLTRQGRQGPLPDSASSIGLTACMRA